MEQFSGSGIIEPRSLHNRLGWSHINSPDKVPAGPLERTRYLSALLGGQHEIKRDGNDDGRSPRHRFNTKRIVNAVNEDGSDGRIVDKRVSP
jgi:hypothetical protein